MGENLPATQSSRVSVPSQSKEVHPDLDSLCSWDVSHKLKKITYKAFFVPFLVPFLLYLRDGNVTNALMNGAILAVVLLVCVALSFAFSTMRNEYFRATWILKNVEPSEMDAEFSCYDEKLDDKQTYATVISVNSREFEPYVITTNGKSIPTSSPDRFANYTRKLKVFFDPSNGDAVVAEDGYGTRYWLRPASKILA